MAVMLPLEPYERNGLAGAPTHYTIQQISFGKSKFLVANKH